MKSFLSLDIDYWNHCSSGDPDREFVRFIQKVPLEKFHIFESHEQILPLINEQKYDCVYNLDSHSDICGFGNEIEERIYLHLNKAEDGSWASHVEWRDSGEYIWVVPTRARYEGHGKCEPDVKLDPFRASVKKKYKSWKDVTYRIGYKSVDFHTLNEGCIVLSPAWVSPIESFHSLFKRLKVYRRLMDGYANKLFPWDTCHTRNVVMPFTLTKAELLKEILVTR